MGHFARGLFRALSLVNWHGKKSQKEAEYGLNKLHFFEENYRGVANIFSLGSVKGFCSAEVGFAPQKFIPNQKTVQW